VADPVFRSSVTSAETTSAESTSAAAVTISDVSDWSKCSVKAGEGTETAKGFAVALGTAAQRNGVLVVHHRQHEWLLLGSAAQVDETIHNLDRDGFVSTVDLTHGRMMLRVSGPRSADVLAKVCSSNFDDAFTPNRAAWGATVARVTCDLVRDDQVGVRSYLLLCDRSYGDYFFQSLLDAADEFAD